MKRTPNLTRPALQDDPTEAFLAGADFHQNALTELTEQKQHARRLVRFTVSLTPEIVEKARWAAYWDRDTLSAIVATALEAEIARREVANGEPYKPNARPLRRGRPIQKAG